MTEFKVGDRVRAVRDYGERITKGREYEVTSLNGEYIRVVSNDGHEDGWTKDMWELVAHTGPVRTVTRREVVAGTYGRLEILEADTRTATLLLDASLTADEIDTLVQHLTAIAEALRES